MRRVLLGADREPSHGHGFTLLELMAVLLVMMMMAGLLLPQFGVTRTAQLRGEARTLAANLELARQRSVMTGKVHRLWIDLDSSTYRLEWQVSESEALGEPEKAEAEFELRADTPIPMAPPSAGRRDFVPTSDRYGNDRTLDSELLFAGIETPSGWIDRGQVGIAFERDGSTDAAEIVIQDPDDRRIVLEVRPLLDSVRIRDE